MPLPSSYIQSLWYPTLFWTLTLRPSKLGYSTSTSSSPSSLSTSSSSFPDSQPPHAGYSLTTQTQICPLSKPNTFDAPALASPSFSSPFFPSLDLVSLMSPPHLPSTTLAVVTITSALMPSPSLPTLSLHISLIPISIHSTILHSSLLPYSIPPLFLLTVKAPRVFLGPLLPSSSPLTPLPSPEPT